MVHPKHYGEENTLFTALTTAEAADVNGGGLGLLKTVGGLAGGFVGGAIGVFIHPNDPNKDAQVGYKVGSWVGDETAKLIRFLV